MAGKPDLKNMSEQGDRDLASARRVLELESRGLLELRDALDGSFSAALDILEAVSGRITVTGMGKSGHVARKIAATLASTGSPAQYVHPAEASHGDLGMITGGDAVLALSNSGNTPELSDILAYTRRYGIPLLAITSKADSTLARNADVALLLPESQEACPLGLAPTTSTTLALAMGDALAVSLLERKGFSSDAFHDLHPGGALGQKLQRVTEIMRKGDDLPLCALDTPMREALITITEKRIGCVGVVDEEGCLAGIITDGDLRRHIHDGFLSNLARDVMTPNPKTIRGDALAAEALALMERYRIKDLFVVEDERPLGITTLHDLLRAGIA